MKRSDGDVPAGRPGQPPSGATAPAIEPGQRPRWTFIDAGFAVAFAAIVAWAWSSTAFALTWLVVGLYLGAVAGRFLGERGDRALSAWRAWSAWEAVPESERKRPGFTEMTTFFGFLLGAMLCLGSLVSWPMAVSGVVGGSVAGLLVAVTVPVLGRWARTSTIRVAIICVGSFLLWSWYWDSIAHPAMSMRMLSVLGVSILCACVAAFPFVRNLVVARRHAARDTRPQAPDREGGPRSG